MRSLNVRQFRAQLASVVERAQMEPVMIERHGRPMAMLIGVDQIDDWLVSEGAERERLPHAELDRTADDLALAIANLPSQDAWKALFVAANEAVELLRRSNPRATRGQIEAEVLAMTREARRRSFIIERQVGTA